MFAFTSYVVGLVSSLVSGTESEREAAAGQLRALEAGMGRAVAAGGYDRGQSNLTGLVIGITIAGVVAVAVAIPVINDVVSSSNVTGTTKTVLDMLDLFIGLLILVAIAAPLMRRA